MGDRPDGTGPDINIHLTDEYGLLKFLLVDMYGRLYTMPSGPLTLDRCGRVVWYDDMESNINHYSVSLSPWGGLAEISPASSHNGFSCLRLYTEGSSGAITQVQKRFPELTKGHIGAEVHLALGVDMMREGLRLDHYTGYRVRHYGLRFDITGPNFLSLFGMYGNNDWYDGPDPGLYADLTTYQALKLVIDLDTGYYDRLLINDHQIDLSSYATYAEDSIDPPGVVLTLFAEHRGDGSGSAYFDELIMTDQEPAESEWPAGTLYGSFGPITWTPEDGG